MNRFPFPLRFSIPTILFLFGAILSASFFQRETYLARKQVEAEAIWQANFTGNQTAGLFEYFYQNQDRRGADLAIGQLGGAPNINMAFILSDRDRVLLSTRLQLRDRPIEETPISHLQETVKIVRETKAAQVIPMTDKAHLWTLHPIGLEFEAGEIVPSRIGILAIKYDLALDYSIAYRDAANRALTYGIAIAILGTILWFFFAKTVTNRASHLVETSKQLARGDLAVRAHLQGSDELYRIAIAFNQMAEEIQKNHDELEQAIQNLKRTQGQLIQAEKMSSLGQMVAGIAHEINNPMNFIYGNLPHINLYTQDLLNAIKKYQHFYPTPIPEIESQLEEIDIQFIADDLPKLLQSIGSGANRVKEIVLGLRTFSRLDEAQNKKIDLNQSLDSTILLLKYRLNINKNMPEIKVIKSYNDLPNIECYASQLNQVFFNIINNSIDALIDTAKQNKEFNNPNISIRTQLIDNDWVRIVIEDNGKGIEPEIQNKIFDPFFTTKPIGSGTGLGLAIAYQIVVDKHGGKLEFNSVVGEGVKFIIEIPQKLSSPEPE